MARASSALCFALTLTACPRAPWPADTVVLLIESPPETLDRRLALSTIAENISGNLIEPGLMRTDADGRAVPDLAESLAQLDPLTYEVTLRPNLRFHDGAPLTAADVVATFETLGAKSLRSPVAARYAEIHSVVAEDDRRIRFSLRTPQASLPSDLSLGIVPARGAAAPDNDEFGRHPLGAGPFRFVAWPDAEHLLLEANPDYYGGKPDIGHLLVKTVRDETTRVLELMRGKADVAINCVSPPLLQLLADSPDLDVLSTSGANAAYLMFQLDDAKLQDARVRRAIAEAIDRDAIARYKFLGRAQPATTLLPPGNWARDAELAPIPHDPADAERLLDEAGLRPDGRGIRLSLTYRTSTDRFRKSIALVLVDQLARVGIDVRLQSLEFGTFFSDVRKGDFELASLKQVPIVDPDLYWLMFASPSVPTAANGFGGMNRGHYENAGVDRWLADARVSADEATRRADYRKVQEALDRDLPSLPLWYEDSTAVVRKGLTGFQVSPYGFFSSLAQVKPTGPVRP